VSAGNQARPAELRLAAESIEALATRLAELLGEPRQQELGAAGEKKMISAAKVSELWGVSRRWVYDHAEELGALRLGSGPRPRLRFDPEEVAERLGVPRRSLGSGDRRRLPSIAGFPQSDSLSAPARAIVGGKLDR
jgi:hypothetical protein